MTAWIGADFEPENFLWSVKDKVATIILGWWF